MNNMTDIELREKVTTIWRKSPSGEVTDKIISLIKSEREAEGLDVINEIVSKAEYWADRKKYSPDYGQWTMIIKEVLANRYKPEPQGEGV